MSSTPTGEDTHREFDDQKVPGPQSPIAGASGRVARAQDSVRDFEDRTIDERLYSSWLTQIRSALPSDSEIEASFEPGVIRSEAATFDTELSGEDRSSILPGALGAPSQEVIEAPRSLYRWALAGLGALLAVILVLSYEVVLPQRRADEYRKRLVGAVEGIQTFSRSYRDLLGSTPPSDFRAAALTARTAVSEVSELRKVVAEGVPGALPVTVFKGRPDPEKVRADAQALLSRIGPLADQIQMRSGLYATLADYQEQLDILTSLDQTNGLEGSDESLVYKGVASNLHSIRASLLDTAIPKGCEDLYSRSMRALESLTSALQTGLAAPGGSNAATLSASSDKADISEAVTSARSALSTPIRQAFPNSDYDDYQAALADFLSRYGS